MEALMQDYKIYAALAYARANRLNRTMIDSPNARLGIIASGKSYLDVLEALEELGINEQQCGGDRHPRVQGGDAVAARAGRRARVRQRPGRDPGGRGKAPDRRVPAQGAALQLARRRAAARDRQVRREGRMGAPARRVAAAGQGRFLHRADRAGHRVAHRALPRQRPDQGAPHLPGGEGGGAQESGEHPAAPGVLLLGMPAQHLDQSARMAAWRWPASVAT